MGLYIAIEFFLRNATYLRPRCIFANLNNMAEQTKPPCYYYACCLETVVANFVIRECPIKVRWFLVIQGYFFAEVEFP